MSTNSQISVQMSKAFEEVECTVFVECDSECAFVMSTNRTLYQLRVGTPGVYVTQLREGQRLLAKLSPPTPHQRIVRAKLLSA